MGNGCEIELRQRQLGVHEQEFRIERRGLSAAAVLGFLAIFTLFGLLTARPLSLSVFYLVTFELALSNLPIRARVYTLLHQVRAIMAGPMPRVPDLYDIPPDLRLELYAQHATAWPELLGVVLVALVLSCILITLRELLPAKVSRE